MMMLLPLLCGSLKILSALSSRWRPVILAWHTQGMMYDLELAKAEKQLTACFSDDS